MGSDENKYEIGRKQILAAHSNGEKDSITISVGDAAYSNITYLEPLYQESNIISITRDRKNRAIYDIFTGEQKNRGRKRYYGKKTNLSKDQDKLTPTTIERFRDTTVKGEEIEVVISEYKNFLVRGKKNHSMKEKPVNFIKVELYDLEGKKIYNNDLWLCVSGKKRNQLTPKEVYIYYKQRFDMEHFFKFAKSKLRFDKLQTINPDRDEDYCMFVMLAYNHLYHLKNHTLISKPYDWYAKKIDYSNPTPAEVYRSLPTVADEFLDIRKPPTKRGIPDRRNVRQTFLSNPDAPVIVKARKKDNIEISIKMQFGEKKHFAKTAINSSKKTLGEFSIKTEEIFDKISKILASNGVQLE